MASTGGFSTLINIKENNFEEDLASFYEFKKNYLLQYWKIVDLCDFIAIERTINRPINRDKIVNFCAILITWEKMQRVPGYLPIYSRLINKRSIVIKTKRIWRGGNQLSCAVLVVNPSEHHGNPRRVPSSWKQNY